jgi:hypothetical protein
MEYLLPEAEIQGLLHAAQANMGGFLAWFQSLQLPKHNLKVLMLLIACVFIKCLLSCEQNCSYFDSDYPICGLTVTELSKVSVRWDHDKKSGCCWAWRRSRHAVVPSIPFTPKQLHSCREKCATGEAALSWVEMRNETVHWTSFCGLGMVPQIEPDPICLY